MITGGNGTERHVTIDAGQAPARSLRRRVDSPSRTAGPVPALAHPRVDPVVSEKDNLS
jgi:hypothetical protein